MKKRLIKEQERLARIIKRTKQELENAPERTLCIGKSQGHPQYYHCKNGTSHNGVYLPKKEIELARQLAQKSYNEKILRYAEKTYRRITGLLKDYEDDKLEQIFFFRASVETEINIPGGGNLPTKTGTLEITTLCVQSI